MEFLRSRWASLGALLDGPERGPAPLAGILPIDPTVHAVHQRALALFAAGQSRDALVLLFDTLGRATPAARTGAALAPLRALVASLLESVAVAVGNDTVLAVLDAVATDPAIAPQAVAPSLLAMLTGSDAARALGSPAESVVTDAVRALVAHPLVAPVLPHIIVGSRHGEALCTRWREALLQRALDPVFLGQRWLWEGVHQLGAAAFNGEYVWPERAEETAMVQALSDALTSALADDRPNAGPAIGALAPVLLAFAMYRPLDALPNSARLAAVPPAVWGDFAASVQDVIQRHVRDRLDERARAARLPRMAPIADAGSRRVRAQYEQHPYPRWMTPPAARVTTVAAVAAELQPQVPPPPGQRVLIAGCGTGRQIAHLAASFPDAHITAIDLSLASLGYAARRLDALGLHHVRLMQGDLLQLDALGESFDLISCSGVLHHLANPRTGWQQLVQRLAPGGVMKIGLYSTTARASVRAARAVLTGSAPPGDTLPASDADLRAARERLLQLPATHEAAAVVDSLDFYALSGVRDLVAHVQERTYTLPELAVELAALDLTFLGFQLPQDVQQRFTAAHPHPLAARDLTAWAAFEAAHPLTFWGMYQFWCAPRSPAAPAL